MNDTFLTCEYAFAYGISLKGARRLSQDEKEKENYSDWFKE